MILLYLNPMTGRSEDCECVARAETKEQLLEFIKRETVERYTTDGRWHKTFRQGGPLEWFNPPTGLDTFYKQFLDVGTREDWLNRANLEWDKLLDKVMSV